jgi:hypothetical protein
MRKKITAWLVAFSLAAGISIGSVDAYGAGGVSTVKAAEVSGSDGISSETTEYASSKNLELKEDIKAAGDFSSAVTVRLGSTINGSITETVDNRLYKFTLASSGRVALNLTSYMKYCSLYIYGNDGEVIWYDDDNKWNENLKYFKDTYEVDLKKGMYYLKVTGYRKNDWDATTGTYALATKFTSAGESCAEPNNDFSEASVIGVNGTVKGQIAENDRYDIYKFSLFKSGRIGLTMTSYMRYNSIYLYDSNGEEIWYSDSNEWNGNLKYKTDVYSLDLANGTYYLKVTGYRKYDWDASTGCYAFKLKYINANVNYKEPNNDFLEAYTLRTDTNLKGQIAINDPYDILKFSLPTSRKVKIIMTSYMKYYTLVLYDSSGEEVWYSDSNEWNANVGYRKDTHTMTLSAGSYYLKVTGYRRYDWDASTGTYTLRVSAKPSVIDAYVSYSLYKPYTGKAIKPSFTVNYKGAILRKGRDYDVSYQNNKKIGDAAIVIKGKGNYAGTKKVIFHIMPKKATVTKAQNSGKGTVTLKWKRDKNVSGYEIYRSTKKNSGYVKIKNISKNKTVSFKDKSLKKGKTYYYKVRSYKILKGWIYRGSSSKEKAVKIKR